ncbi:hypothetical protein WJX84_009912 [Apatococcus fuscideae]|uniref:Uncharacterized protein n=1 Tax=Apatococcus fuscideae TaxID=2026836 RepID=A0AAW1T5X1_9CHLO
MGLESFCGLCLIAAGPAAVVYVAVIARKSFLVLLTLASAFYWLVVLMVISALVRGFVPLPDSPGPYAALLIACVAIEEAARAGLYQLHRRLMGLLEGLAARQQNTNLSTADKLSMVTAHGLAHGLTHTVFLCISWLPLTLDVGTYYSDACPQMSVFLASALLSLSFLMIHTASMVVVFSGAAAGKPLQRFGPSALHLIAALLTLSSFGHGGCVASVFLSFLIGVAAVGCAVHVAWRSLHPSTLSSPSH